MTVQQKSDEEELFCVQQPQIVSYRITLSAGILCISCFAQGSPSSMACAADERKSCSKLFFRAFRSVFCVVAVSMVTAIRKGVDLTFPGVVW